MLHNSHNISPPYFDRKLGWIIYPILGISFIFFANDNDFKTLVQLPSFKWDVVFSIFAASLIGFYLAWLTRYLDKKHPWEKDLKKRASWQVLLGILAPLFFSIGLEVIYLQAIDINIRQSGILILELPLSFLYLFIINLLFYLNYISFAYQKNLRSKSTETTSVEKVKILEGAKENLIPVHHISFIRSTEKTLWLHTFQDKQFFQNGTLNDWEAKLPKQFFYRLNRQFIVHRDAIENIEPTATRRLKVVLKNFNGEDIFIPKTKATAFRNWWQS
ncbi:LytTR family DNA-binding domain-containing protein [Echinicola sp. 20G]|uniref:LytTR family DNA-binding domain-containing protein n=1 Tax=Echinicola sp. 20G TaxID=2781961 RepID=UPI001910F120|nr:LytTR family DNA-binding domain-containing protein [Echinicola sp. 20G]